MAAILPVLLIFLPSPAAASGQTREEREVADVETLRFRATRAYT
jgi:hypothetical protein